MKRTNKLTILISLFIILIHPGYSLEIVREDSENVQNDEITFVCRSLPALAMIDYLEQGYSSEILWEVEWRTRNDRVEERFKREIEKDFFQNRFRLEEDEQTVYLPDTFSLLERFVVISVKKPEELTEEILSVRCILSLYPCKLEPPLSFLHELFFSPVKPIKAEWRDSWNGK